MIQHDISMTTSSAVWVATAMLHQENKDRDAFQPKEIFKKIRDNNLVQTKDSTIMAHITVHCVANSKPWPNTHRKLFRVSSGWYRLYKNGDEYNPQREGGASAPLQDTIPSKYRNLLDWYNTKYNTGSKTKSTKPSLTFTTLEKDGVVKLSANILSKLKLAEGDYVAFVENSIGDITLKKATMQVE